MVRCRKALVVHASGSACRDDYDLRLCDSDLICLYVHENRSAGVSLVVLDDFYRGSKVNDRDFVRAVENLVAESAHDFGSRIVLACMHTLAARSASVCRDHRAVSFLVEFNAEVVQPFDYGRGLVYKSVDKLRLSVEVSAAESVKIVLCRGIVRLVRRLNSAFRHHCVGVSDAELCCKKDIRSCLACHDCGRCSGSASADYENVRLIVNVGKVDVLRLKARFRLKHCRKLNRRFLSLVRSDFKLLELACDAVRMIFLEKLILFVSSETRMFEFKVFFTFCSNNFGCFVQFVSVHIILPGTKEGASVVVYFSISRLL